MWENAHALGASLRRLLGVRTRVEALRAARIAYRMIGIDLRADENGDVTVDRCGFAEWYSPQVCILMSSLDAGLIAGLTDGGRLAFSERITEGDRGASPGSPGRRIAVKKRAVVVGSGAGGATVAKELQGEFFDVTVVEAGKDFRRVTLDRRAIERLRRSRLLVDPRLVRLVYPPIRIRRTPEHAPRERDRHGRDDDDGDRQRDPHGWDLRVLGLDLDPEFDDIAREIPITTAHQRRWHPHDETSVPHVRRSRPGSSRLAEDRRCRTLPALRTLHARLSLRAQWDSRTFLEEAVQRGARLMTRSAVTKVVIEDGRATGVVARRNALHRFVPADLVVLAAGGFGTPAILERSGIECEQTLFVDPVLTVAARVPNAWQCNEIEMPFFVQREGYILSPYFDWISSLFHPSWRHRLQDIVGIMIKLADDNVGSVSGRKVHKLLTPADRSRLDERWGSPPRSWGRSASTRKRCSSERRTRVTPAACCHSPRRPRPRCTTTGCPRTCSLPTPPSSRGRSETRRSSRSSRWRNGSPRPARPKSRPRAS